MSRHILRMGRLGRLAGLVLPAVAAVLIGSQVRSSAQPAAGASAEVPGALAGSSTEALVAKAGSSGLKFLGASDCMSEKCHGRPEPLKAPKQAGNEYNLWAGEDPHNKAFESIGKGDSEKAKKGQAIWTAYKAAAGAKEATASESQRCLTCHALAAPKPLQGAGFNQEEGVTCNSCHGPYSKAREPHSKEGWMTAERAAAGGDPTKIFDKWGIIDTKVVQARADKCTSCHLAIDADMVKAGHPQPKFELFFYSSSYPGRHWKQEEGYFGVKLWSVGQVVSLRDAMYQLSQRAANAKTPDDQLKTAYDQAMAHYTVFSPLLKAPAMAAAAADAKGLDGWAADLKAKMAAKDKAGIAKAATNAMQYATRLTKPVTALVPDKALTMAVLTTIAGQTTTITESPDLGADQQRNAVYALYTSLATSKDKPADAEAVQKLINEGGLYPPEGKDKADPAAYAKALAEIKGKLK